MPRVFEAIQAKHREAQARNAQRGNALPVWMVSTGVFASVVGVTLIPIIAGGAVGALFDPENPSRGASTGALGAASGMFTGILVGQAVEVLNKRANDLEEESQDGDADSNGAFDPTA